MKKGRRKDRVKCIYIINAQVPLFRWASSKLCQAFNGGRVQSGSRLAASTEMYVLSTSLHLPYMCFLNDCQVQTHPSHCFLLFLAQSFTLIALVSLLFLLRVCPGPAVGLARNGVLGKRSEGSPHPKQQPAMPLGDIHASKPQISHLPHPPPPFSVALFPRWHFQQPLMFKLHISASLRRLKASPSILKALIWIFNHTYVRVLRSATIRWKLAHTHTAHPLLWLFESAQPLKFWSLNFRFEKKFQFLWRSSTITPLRWVWICTFSTKDSRSMLWGFILESWCSLWCEMCS